MSKRHCDIAIIGAGTAGLHAYKAADEAGAEVVLIERGPGGSTCTRSGCIPSKLLIAAARAAAAGRKADVFGVRSQPIAVDGPAVMDRVRAERDKADGKIKREFEEVPEGRRIRGDARFIGPATLVVGDEEVVAGSVIIAVGATPEIPKALEPVSDLVHTHLTIFEIKELPEAMAVVGAGPLGLELAQAFARLGVEVTVLDKSEKVGALSDPECDQAARNALTRDFAIHSGVDLTASQAGNRARLAWTGADEGSIEVDFVLAATGRKPNLAGLDIKAAGLATDENGEPEFNPETRRCGTSPVFVAGDVGGWRPVLHEAARGGTIASMTASGGEPLHPVAALAIAFTEPNLVEVGASFDRLPGDALIGTALANDNARSGIDADDEGLLRLYADRQGRLLGGTMVLTGGEHLGQSLALAIGRGMTAPELAEQAWYHPCLEEMLQEAARDICRQLQGGGES